MNKYWIVFVFFFLVTGLFAQTKKYKRIKYQEIESAQLIYDRNILRLPNTDLSFGVGVALKNGEHTKTLGYLKGTSWWRNFRFEVDGGYYLFRRLYIANSSKYSKDQFITVKVFYRKNDSLLAEKKIPLNYETGLEIISQDNFVKAPGRHIKLDFKKTYDNGNCIYLKHGFGSRNVTNKLDLSFSGGSLKHKGMAITTNVDIIKKHEVACIASLKKKNAICDTFSVQLDYIDTYKYNSAASSGFSGSSGPNGANGSTGSDGSFGAHAQHGENGSRGHDFDVLVDAYYDEILECDLLRVKVVDLYSNRERKYLVNPNGSVIKVTSYGGDGGCGGRGGDGGDGGKGANGSEWTEEKQVNDSTVVTVDKVGPAQDGGNGGCGGDGGIGGRGGDGGNIVVIHTVAAQKYIGCVHALSLPGSGGSGGSAGSGGTLGKGGNGEPDGNNGNNGHSGRHGPSAYDGRSGIVEYMQIDLWEW